ncbi:MAG TPA: GAF domain-containing sensor histidine kinase [Longilinea sp.]|nr:GAF domain-containing sensor histidine kinase [Longilinea sp.]
MNNPSIQQEMKYDKHVINRLVNLLNDYQNEIASAWARAIKEQMQDSIYGKYPLEEISKYNLIGVKIIQDLLLGVDIFSEKPPQYIPEVLSIFVQASIPIQEVLEGMWLFQEVIQGFLLQKNNILFPPKDVSLLLNDCIHKLVLNAAKMYTTGMNLKLEEEHQQTVLMLEMSRLAGSSLEIAHIIQHTSQRMASAAGVKHCVICLIDDYENSFCIAAMTDNQPSELADYLLRFASQSFHLKDAPLLQQIVSDQKIFYRYQAEAEEYAFQLTRNQLGVEAVLVVPIVLKDRVLAVAFIYSQERDISFTDHQIDVVSGLASVVAPALENARLYQEVERMAMLEERARLAQEIHDDLSQSICAIQFRIFMANDSLMAGEISKAQMRVNEVLRMLDQANRNVHEVIFNLRAVSNFEKGFLKSLEDFLETYRKNYCIDVQLTVDKNVIESLRGITGVHTIRIIQEAVSNAHRHGNASQVDISIQHKDKGIDVDIKDNGIGFDICQVSGPDQQHFGISIMRERAEKISGNLQVDSEVGVGTRIVLHLPEPGTKNE